MAVILMRVVYSMIAILGLCVLFRVPVNRFIPCMLVGAAGMTTYYIMVYYTSAELLSCYVAALIVGLASMQMAYMLNEATNVFLIPGIIVLAPGSTIFLTMEAFAQQKFGLFSDLAFKTIMMAGAIALGFLTSSAVRQAFKSVVLRRAEKGDKTAHVK